MLNDHLIANFEKPVHVPQKTDTQLQTISTSRYSIQFAYARSSDSRINNKLGQDQLSFFCDQNYIGFVLCDGVGQSFFGDIAARIAGRGLLAWLKEEWIPYITDPQQYPPTTTLKDKFKTAVTHYLESIVEQAQLQVQNQKINPDLNNITREALEDKRRLGSETTVVCGFIRLPSDELPQGDILLAFSGNSKIWLYDNNHQLTDRTNQADFENKDHWSTKRGLINKQALRISYGDLSSIGRICAYTDGLDEAADKLRQQLSASDLNELIKNESQFTGSDDIAFFDISFNQNDLSIPTPSEPQIKWLDTPKFSKHLLDFQKSRIFLRWDRISNADYYEFQKIISRTNKISDQLTANETEIPFQKCSDTQIEFKIRAVRATAIEPFLYSEWSEPLLIKLPRCRPIKPLVGILVSGLALAFAVRAIILPSTNPTSITKVSHTALSPEINDPLPPLKTQTVHPSSTKTIFETTVVSPTPYIATPDIKIISSPNVTPTLPKINPQITITANKLNVRPQPNTNQQPLGYAIKGDSFQVQARNRENTWVKVIYDEANKKTGWISLSYGTLNVNSLTLTVE